MEDVNFETPALAAEVAAFVTDAGVRASYSAGPLFEEQSGRPAELSVILANSSLNGGPVDPIRELASRIAPVAMRWLIENDRILPGTIVTVTFADEKHLGPFSMFNALETVSFETSGGELTPVEPNVSREFEEGMRRMRYRMSGRKPPTT